MIMTIVIILIGMVQGFKVSFNSRPQVDSTYKVSIESETIDMSDFIINDIEKKEKVSCPDNVMEEYSTLIINELKNEYYK